MENENNGENQSNQETAEQAVERIRKERDGLKKTNETYKAQKSHWKKKAEAKANAKVEPNKSTNKETKTDEPDYARLAFLEQRGLTNPEDQKLVQDEAERLKMPLTDVLGMEHIKSKLKTAKDTREAADGMPKGRGKPGGQSQQDVDYHLAKGTTPDDLELAEKVIAARIKQEGNANKFSDELYTG